MPASRKPSCVSPELRPTPQLPWPLRRSLITLWCNVGLLEGRDYAFLISVLLATDLGLAGTVST